MLGGWGAGMTSDSDDLEQQLRENLKLRRELAAEVAKARGASEGRGSAYRLGWVLYWLCVIPAAVLAAVLWTSAVSDAIQQEWWREFDLLSASLALLVIALPSLVLYALGRAVRYMLSGE
jgi:hypothetical protein